MNPVFTGGIFYSSILFCFAAMADYVKAGRFITAHGLKGELLLSHHLGKKTGLKGLTAIFTEEKKGSFLPWFIEEATPKNEEEIYLKLEGLDTREAAMKLARKEVWLPEAEFKKYAAKSSPVNLLGYTILNGKENLGEIMEVIEQPHQLLCRLEIKGREVLVPLHENSLEKIDHKKKQVIVDLPEGLLDIYLNG